MSSMLRLVAATPGVVQVDTARDLGGRGAWVHRRQDCSVNALHKGRLERSLRTGNYDRETLRKQIAAAAGAAF